MEWCAAIVIKNFLLGNICIKPLWKTEKIKMQDCLLSKISTMIKKKVLKETKEKDLKGNIPTQ